MTELFTPLHILFYAFAAVAVASAVNVVLAKNPVRSVLSLVVTFFAVAGSWMLLRTEFLSIILIVVYVGAVMTLFLFVIMMLNIDREAKKGGYVHHVFFVILIVAALAGALMYAVTPNHLGPVRGPATELIYTSDTATLGLEMYTDYLYPFEIAGVILLVAIIAAITLANRGPLRRRVQNPGKQAAVNPKDRVRLVKMPSEPKQGSKE